MEKQNKKRQGPHAWPWMIPVVVFCMKDRFFSLSLCLHLSLSLFLAGCVESERCFVCLQPGGKTELQSQAAK